MFTKYSAKKTTPFTYGKLKNQFEVTRDFFLLQGYKDNDAVNKALEIVEQNSGCFLRSSTKDIASIQSLIRTNKYSILKLTLYGLIVPITAQVILAALSKTGINSYMMWATAIVLALATDYIAIEHISKVKSLQTGTEQLNLAIAIFIIFANLVGAFLLFEKKINLDQLSTISSERNELNQNLEDSLLFMTKVKTTYLLNKWPKSTIDRSLCETNRTPECGPMFAKQSRPFEAKYLTAKQLYEHRKSELENLPTAVPQAQAKTELWWHFGYYIFIWLLLGSVIRMEKLSQA